MSQPPAVTVTQEVVAVTVTPGGRPAVATVPSVLVLTAGTQGPAGVAGPPGAAGAPGTADHAALSHLDYASAGHTGFVPAARSVLAGAGLSGGGVLSADVTLSLPDAGTPGTYGDATHYAAFTTDAQGRVTAVTLWPVAPGGVTSWNGRAGAVTLQTADVAAALPAGVARTDAPNTFAVTPQTVVCDADSHAGVVVRAHSSGQSANLQEWQDGAAVTLSLVDAGGDLMVRRDKPAVQMYVSATPLAGFAGVWFGRDPSTADTHNYSLLGNQTTTILNAPGTLDFRVFNITGLIMAGAVPRSVFTYLPSAADGDANAVVSIIPSNLAYKGLAVQGRASQSAVLCQLQGVSSAAAVRPQADLDAVWADPTDATRKAHFVLRAWDTAAREVVRGGADGSGPTAGFLGAPAQPQQPIGVAATDLASALALANNIRTALINFGLCKT